MPLALTNQLSGNVFIILSHAPSHIYNWYERYLQRFAPPLRPLVVVALKPCNARMDCVITNSENMCKRLDLHLGLESEVIHLPVDTERF